MLAGSGVSPFLPIPHIHLPEVFRCCRSPLGASQAAFPPTRLYTVVPTPSHIPPPQKKIPCRAGFPDLSYSPLLNTFWLQPIPSPEDLFPPPRPGLLPSGARCGREVALCPHGRDLRRFLGGTPGVTLPVSPHPRGGEPPRFPVCASYHPPPPLQPPARGLPPGKKKKNHPSPSLQNLALYQKKKKSGRGGVVLQPGVIYPPGL